MTLKKTFIESIKELEVGNKGRTLIFFLLESTNSIYPESK
jgi:hypothetical protein